MKVILSRDVPKVGRDGEIVNVADGFARNYLFPRQYAVPASGGALKAYQARAAREKERGARQLQEAQTGAEKLEGLTVLITAKVGSGTKLYGSITAQDVADAIKRERGLEIDKRRIGLVDPIKSLGAYSVPVRLHSDLSVPVTVDVVTADELERRKLQAEAAARSAAEAQQAAAEAEAGPSGEAAAEEPAAEAATEPTDAAS